MNEGMLAAERSLGVKVRLTLATGSVIELGGADVISFSVQEGSDSALLSGNVLSAKLSLKLRNDEGQWRWGGSIRGERPLVGATAEVFVVNGGGELPCGAFIIDTVSAKERSGAAELSGSDSIASELAVTFRDGLSYPATLGEVWAHLVGQTRYVFGGEVPNGAAVIDSAPEWGSVTLRKAAGWIAQAAGCFVRVSRTGALELVKCTGGEAESLGPEAYWSLDDGFCEYGPVEAVQVTPLKSEESFTVSDGDGTGETVSVEGNPLFIEGAENGGALAAGMLAQLKGLTLAKASFVWRGDPAVGVGARIALTDTYGSTTVCTVTRQTMKFENGFSAECVCSVPDAGDGGIVRAITPEGGVNAGALVGAVDGGLLATESVTAKSIAARSITAEKIAAGSVSADHLAAGSVTAGKLEAGSVTADKLDANTVSARVAEFLTAEIGKLSAGDVSTSALYASFAHLIELAAGSISAGDVTADRLGAALAEFVTMYAGVGEFDFATIQNLVAKALSLERASAESVYIRNLAVTSANLLSATLGKLVLKGDDGKYYHVFVGSDGSISTEEIVPTDSEIQNGQTSGGQQIVETMMNVGSLNATNLQASSAVINQILTTALTAEKITAADALIASASIPTLYTTSIKALGAGLDLSANEYIKLVVGEIDSKIAAKSNVFRGETAPEGANLNDLWIVPSTGYTYQLVADDSVHPSYYLDENGYLYYEYASGQTAYPLQMDASGDLYISEDADFIAAITQDGAPALWERVKDGELADAAQAALEAAQAAQDKANQNAEDMAEVVTQFESEFSSLQSQIDGNITSWFEYGVPTASNYPASQWTTAELKNAHLGDLYYDRNTGYCYRWQLSGSTYSWLRIADTDVTKALSDAAAAKDVADSKRRVFVSTPTPPYDIGDLWVQGANGDIMRCQYARAAGGYYYESDWVKASKYTDDTLASQNAQIIAEHTSELQLMDSRITARVEQSISEVSGELETQISSSFSEVTQTVNELRVEMVQNRAADKDEMRTYIRYADGRVELGRSDSRYVSQTSDSGFVVLQDGSPMASIVQNTISAPVIEANRMFAIGGFALRLGANGHLILA